MLIWFGVSGKRIQLLAGLFLLRDKCYHRTAGEDQNRRPKCDIGVIAGLRGLVGGRSGCQNVEGGACRIVSLLDACDRIQAPQTSSQRIAVVAAQLIQKIPIDPQSLVVIGNAVVVMADFLTADPDCKCPVRIIVNQPAGFKLDPNVFTLDIVVQAICNCDTGIRVNPKLFRLATFS